MFKKCILILAASCMMYSCATQTESNPFLTEFQTPNGVPPFDKIKLEHYEPAFQKGIEEQNANIQAIIDNTEAPTFENVIVALDNSSPTLDRVGGVFFNLTEAETTDELTALSMKLAPTLAEHEDNISLNQELFKKVDAVYSQQDALGLTREQQRLLEKTHKKFIRSGANLPADKQARLREINKQLSTLGITFSNNILNENNDFKLYVGKEEDLAGLPQWFRESAMAEARATGQEGKWLFTLHNASRLPFLQYSANRPLREQMYKAYINRGNNNDKNDNKKIIADIVSLRLEKAQLLGFDCYSNFVLDNTMAKNSTAVMDFLNNLWSYALPKAKAEAAELQKLMDKEGKGEKLEAWDWWYYTEKLRKEKYNLEEEEIKPYFKLENVREGAFAVANKLYGITLTKLEGDLTPEAVSLLDSVAGAIYQYNDNYITIEGHTDSNPINTAKFPDNMMLSVHRAHSVYNYLVNNKGFDAKTMTSSGRGENVPIADNTTAEGRAQNRRVEIKIYNNLNSDIQ